MLRRSARNSSDGGAVNATLDSALQPISRNLRSASREVASTWAQRNEDGLASKTPSRKRQLQQTPNTAYTNTAKRARITPGRGWLQPTTPHGIRAMELRRAALTPSRTRRQSGRARGDPTRDALRALTRVLPRPPKPPEPEIPEPTVRSQGILDEDSSSEEASPRFSFGVDGLDESLEVDVEKARRASERFRLSLVDSSILGGDMFESDEDEEKPVTTLLDEPLDSDDLEPPEEATFGQRDLPGDTQALRQLMALTRSPETPQSHGAPLTPTADFSFALNMPDIPAEMQRTPELSDNSDDNDNGDIGGFQLPDEDTEELEPLDTQQALDTAGFSLDLAMPKPLDVQLAQKGAGKTRRKYSKRAPRRDGLSKGVIKKVAASFIPNAGLKTGRLKRGAVDALVQATDWFFEQVSDDLAAYSQHAGRRKIDESDFLLLARRQRLLTPKSTLFSLASKYLPRELLRDVGGVTAGRKTRSRPAPPGRSEEGEEADEDS